MPATRRSTSRSSRRAKRPASRRGAASVLSMMFLILFGSLVAAMAVASGGNIRTASTHLNVMQAMSAAETGLEIAEARLAEAANRFVLSESTFDADLTWALWTGAAADMGDHVVLDAPSAFTEASPPAGLAEAVRNHFAAESNVLSITGYINAPVIAAAPSDASSATYRQESWVFTPPIGLRAQVNGGPTPPAYQVRFAPLADGVSIRIIADGFVFDQGRAGAPIRRTLVRDFRLGKRVEHAIISPSRVMIGKNVMVTGSIGAQYDDLEFDFGDPLVLRSDFMGIDPVLDEKLEAFFDVLGQSGRDADMDNRLRFGHPGDRPGDLPNNEDYDGDDAPDAAFADATGDGFLDEYDIFINHFDTDGDRRIRLADEFTVGTPSELLAGDPEMVDGDGAPIDPELAYLIDSSQPDRNGNGVFGFTDTDGDFIFTGGVDFLLDFDPATSTFPDQVLGYRDGYLDALDPYAKLAGNLRVLVSAADWANEQGDLNDRIRGPILSDNGDPPVEFEVDNVPSVNANTFNSQESDLIAAADGDPFWEQVSWQVGLGSNPERLLNDTWTAADNPSPTDAPFALPLWSRDNRTGRPTNADEARWEPSPIGTGVWPDYYYRPVFRNMVFRNVVIPMGLNALFENCTFVGVTLIETDESAAHTAFAEYGKMFLSPDDGQPIWTRPRKLYDGTVDDDYLDEGFGAPAALPEAVTPPEANVWAADDASQSFLDLGDVLSGMEGLFDAGALAELPAPLIVDVDGVSQRIIDTRDISNNIRFHDCLFVGSIVSEMPAVYTNTRNKLQFTGATRFTQQHPVDPYDGFLNPDADDMDLILSSSMMLPNYSVEVGMINNPADQNLNLSGLIVAGVLDMRGRASLDGALMLTYDPVVGEGPMVDTAGNPAGNPAGYNATIGFFELQEGDFESFNMADLPEINGELIIGWDLDGDGLADLDYSVSPTQEQLDAGAAPVPFNGFGQVRLNYDPDMVIPRGIMLPVSAIRQSGTYQEGHW